MAEQKIIDLQVKTDKALTEIEKLKKKLEKTEKDVSKVNESTKTLTSSLDNITGGAVTKFKNFTKALKSVSLGFKSIKTAIAASGIGLLIVVLGSITAAFRGSEEGQNKFAKLMGVIGAVVGNVIDVLADFGDFIINLFSGNSEAIKSLKSFGKSIYDFIGLPIKNVIDSTKTLGRVLGALFSGDIDKAFNELKQGVQDIKDNFTEATDVINGASAAVANFAKQNIDEAKAAAKVADQRAKADKIERDLIVDRAKAEREIANLRLKARDLNNTTAKERETALKRVLDISDDLIAREKQVAELRSEAQTAENTFARSTKENLTEEERLKARVIQLETARLNQQRQIQRELTAAENEQRAARQARAKELETERKAKEKELEAERKAIQDKLDKENKTAAESEIKRLEAIKAIQEKYKQKEADDAAKTEIQKLELEQSRALLELETLNATEEQKFQVKKYWENLIAEEKILTDTKTAEEEKRIAEELAKAKETEYRNNYDALQNILSSGGKKMQKISKALAIADVARTAFQSVSQTVSGIGAANAKAIAASPLTGGMPFVAINTVKGALSIASTLASSAKSIQAINSESKNASGAGGGLSGTGGGGGGAAAPSFNIVGQTGTNQLAQTIGQQQQPVQAFVVASQVTTQQSFDNNIVETATLG